MKYIAYYPRNTRRKPVEIEARNLDLAEAAVNKIDSRWEDIVEVRG